MGVSQLQKLKCGVRRWTQVQTREETKKHEPFIKAVKNNTNKRADRGRNLNSVN